jgi:two-component system NtrC family sensor kinase
MPPIRSALARILRERGSLLVACMLLAIGGVMTLAWWDSLRESDAVFRDVGDEQSVLASVVAVDLRAHLSALERHAMAPGKEPKDAGSGLVVHLLTSDGHPVSMGVRAADLLGTLSNRPGELRVLLAPPGERGFYTADDQRLDLTAVRDALDRGLTSFRLSRAEAAAAGLVARTAMAGIARVDAGDLGRWGVIAIGTAARQRDREMRALWRLVLGVGVASALILAFGGLALRKERKELALERELAVTHAQQARDDQLARAERVATMGTFAMGVIHEVSTPLGVIVGRAEQLRARAGQDERAVYAAQTILQQVDRIQVVIRRFLDMARGGPPSLAKASPGDVVRAAAASVEHRFARAGVSLDTDTPPGTRLVLCDRALLEQALVNLLLNACDACRSGGRAQVAVRSEAEWVSFVVTDDGEGIAPDAAARAKEPFFTTKGPGAGTGLGLAIASEIAKSLRGQLTIVPNGERGTRASIAIPAATG